VSAAGIAADVLVFGSGLTGCLVALDLAHAGRRTVIVDSGDDEAQAPGHVPSGPPLIYVEAVRRWGRDGARELWELQREAHAELLDLVSEWACDGRYRSAGGFTLALTRPEGIALADGEDLLREDGFPGEFLDAYLFEARFDVRGFAAAYWAEGEAELEGAALKRAAASAAREAGATFMRPLPGAAPDVLRDGVSVATTQGVVTAPVAVLATPTAAPLAGAFFDGRLTATMRRGSRWPVGDAALCSPARTVAGGAGWTTVGELVLEVAGEGDPAAFAAEHLSRPAGPPGGSWARPSVVSRDGLPWVGAIPETALVAALVSGDDLGYAPLVSRWASTLLLTGRDPTPAPLRAARSILP
jgi:glycine/D-amino acid oxidase-like deaminating enzyme